jgi:hypothetical protein
VPRKLLSRLLNIPAPAPKRQTNQNLSDYAGSYLMNYGGSRLTHQFSDFTVYATLTTSGDTLFLRQPMGEKTFLRPAGKDSFLLSGSENTIYVFNRGKDGKVSSMTIHAFLFGGGATEVENKKVSVPIKPDEKIVSLPLETLKKYAGTYYNTMDDGYLFIVMDGDKLFGHRVNATPKFELLPTSHNTFVRKGVEEFKIRFKENKEGMIILTASAFRDTDYRKISD